MTGSARAGSPRNALSSRRPPSACSPISTGSCSWRRHSAGTGPSPNAVVHRDRQRACVTSPSTGTSRNKDVKQPVSCPARSSNDRGGPYPQDAGAVRAAPVVGPDAPPGVCPVPGCRADIDSSRLMYRRGLVCRPQTAAGPGVGDVAVWARGARGRLSAGHRRGDPGQPGPPPRVGGWLTASISAAASARGAGLSNSAAGMLAYSAR